MVTLVQLRVIDAVHHHGSVTAGRDTGGGNEYGYAGVLPGPDLPSLRLTNGPCGEECLGQEVGRTDVQASPASGSLAGRPVALASLGEALELPFMHAGQPILAECG